MNTTQHFDSDQADLLRAFLDAPQRSPGSMSYGEAAGFLFVVTSAPELIQPSEWLPFIIDPDNAEKASIEKMQAIVGGLMALYNELNQQVQDVAAKLPPGLQFMDDPMANLEPDATISQWSRGFRTGYLWLEEMWSDYRPKELEEEFGYQLAVLSFFGSEQVANAIFDEVKNEDLTLEDMAANMQRIFPDAMHGVVLLGNSLQQVILKRGQATRQPAVRSEKVGRNDPCSCGSGKKFKKCCGSV